uniref:Uncharacterized protein n=1 Tax=Callorhinchus milii TaxID=7868 RepID=A0A4W3IV44_CALMI
MPKVPRSAVLQQLEGYQQRFGEFSEDKFQQTKVRISGLNSTKGTKVWNMTWLKCQEVRQLLEEKLEICRKALRDGNDHCTGDKKSPGDKVQEGSDNPSRFTLFVFESLSHRDLFLLPLCLLVISSTKLQRIMEEMLITERKYVRSLGYIIAHYFPEMERPDLPQDLRGQRATIFGNLEKLHDFHSQYFLKELEACVQDPISVGHSFLRYEEQFALYALYSKNKPQSDFLLSSHGNTFFRSKQLELGDKMDLASYLLKPIQRISKYNLLLKDMIKECGTAQSQERKELLVAHEIVRFQLRHGNDLLAMDDIQECDVNLKEQGQLLRQDEFIIWYGRKKLYRHVFLFEDLILFSKTKKTEGSNDIYIYKQSFKTSEIGITHNSGESGLRFEIWFRRQKSQDTYILHSPSPEVKQAWIEDLERILWNQALRNRELRMQERVFMGIGCKPFMDIKPSEAAINDRAVDCVTKGKDARMPTLLAGAVLEQAKRPNSTGSNGSICSSGSHASSSSSGFGSLNMHLYASSPSTSGGTALINGAFYNMHMRIDEDDLECDPDDRRK